MRKRVYSTKQHSIAIEQIDRHALYVVEKLRSAGHTAYIVGGCVRDLLLSQKPKDYDVSTSALPEEIRALFRNCLLIGRRFRLAHIRFGKKIIEVSTFRSGDPSADELILRDNEWGTEEEDVLRRDFTINGLFYDAHEQKIIDYVGGFPDIEQRFLRTIGQPYLRFRQDPVRMIRLLKFQARFGLEIDEEAKVALLECRHEILKSAQARVFEELLRMLESGHSAKFFHLLHEYGILELILPAVASFLDSDRGQEILLFLEEIDLIVLDPEIETPCRSVLLSPILYPIFYAHLHDRFTERGRHLHLGEVQTQVRHLLDEVFSTFFKIPRRLRIQLSSILSGQVRLTPLEPKKSKSKRIPGDPDFPLAVDFLEIRSRVEPSLQIVAEEWRERIGKIQREKPVKKRRRKPRLAKRKNG